METQTETYTGANCSGSNGASNRVLTLSNTGFTIQAGFLVYVSGLALTVDTEYTVNHLNSSTTITFLNPLYNDMTITVKYQQSVAASLATDFQNGPLVDFGITVTRTPVTVSTDFHGDKTYTDGADNELDVVFENPEKAYPIGKEGLPASYDARMFTKPTETINRFDKITHNSKVYRVETVNPRSFNGTVMFKMVTLFYLEDE